MEDDIPVIVRMRVKCANCGHDEDQTYEFDMPIAEAQEMVERTPGKCPDCGAPVSIHLGRKQQMQ
jgi:endogenous inhibitor of DNA gyrase (YacG/DUF329 family)